MMSQALSEKSCRVCLQQSDQLHSLSDNVEYTDIEKFSIQEILSHITSLEFRIDESIPNNICYDCTEKLLGTYEFICTIVKSEKQWESQLENGDYAIDIENSATEIEDDKLEVLDDFSNIVDISEPIIEREIPITECQEDQTNEDVQLTTNTVLRNKIPSSHGLNIGSRLSNYGKSSWIECDKCSRRFAKEVSLQRHIQIAHTYIPIEKIDALAPKPDNKCPFKCSYCPRIFARPDNLNRHLQLVHPEIKTEEAAPQREKKVYKRGLCPHCGISFPLASLNIHIRRHTGEKPYKCDECEKCFPRRQDLVVHKRQHTGERPHICTYCGKSFIRPNKLTRHLRVHTGVRPYKCTLCNKCFSQSNDLKLHFRRHSGEKPYKCEICSDAFISGTALKEHKRLNSHYDQPTVNVPI